MRSTSRIKSGSPGFVLWSEFTSDSIHSTQLAQLYPHSQYFHHLFVVIQNPGKNALVILQRILACLTTHPSTNDFAQTTRLQVSSNYHIVAEKTNHKDGSVVSFWTCHNLLRQKVTETLIWKRNAETATMEPRIQSQKRPGFAFAKLEAFQAFV